MNTDEQQQPSVPPMDANGSGAPDNGTNQNAPSISTNGAVDSGSGAPADGAVQQAKELLSADPRYVGKTQAESAEQTARLAVPTSVASAPAPAAGPAVESAASPAASPAAVQDTYDGDVSDEDLEAQLAFETIKRKRQARKRKRIIIVAAIVAVALVAAVVWIVTHTGTEDDGEDYDPLAATSTVYRGDFATTINANGATEPLSSVVVTPEVDGIIENLSIEQGSVVKEGDVLFTIKNEELDKGVREAEQALSAAYREADSANRAVESAYASYNNAAAAYNNADEDEEDEEDVAEFDAESYQDSIDAAEESYQSALEGIESAKAALEEAKAMADKRTVRAPVSGTVVAMNAKSGAAYGGDSASDSLVQISDLSQMKVTVQVNEVDIASIAEGQEAVATFAALPDVELDAKVQRIASVASGSESESYDGGVVTYAVDLLIPKPDPNLKPGMTATVTITTQSADDVLIVPSSAIWTGDEDEADDETDDESDDDEAEAASDEEATLANIAAMASAAVDDAAGPGQKAYVTVVDPDTQKTHNVEVKVIVQNNSEAAVSPDGELQDGDLVLLGGSEASMGDDEDYDEGISDMLSFDEDI